MRRIVTFEAYKHDKMQRSKENCQKLELELEAVCQELGLEVKQIEVFNSGLNEQSVIFDISFVDTPIQLRLSWKSNLTWNYYFFSSTPYTEKFPVISADIGTVRTVQRCLSVLRIYLTEIKKTINVNGPILESALARLQAENVVRVEMLQAEIEEMCQNLGLEPLMVQALTAHNSNDCNLIIVKFLHTPWRLHCVSRSNDNWTWEFEVYLSSDNSTLDSIEHHRYNNLEKACLFLLSLTDKSV